MTRTAPAAALLALLFCSTPLSGQRCGSRNHPSPQPGNPCASRSARRVLDGAAIAAAGWHHLGDIAAALPPGTTASVDGFNHALTGSRVGFVDAGGSSARWMVRLDGQSMPVSIEGLWILDAIPVAITQLDSIVVTDGPRIVDGRAVFLGTIDLYTRRPRNGLSALADYQHGDESGDPGPYRYTARASPNVEKLGPFASGAVAIARGGTSLDAAARYSSLNITDPAISRRLPGVFGALQSDVNASGGSGILTSHIAGGDHYLIAGRGRFTGLMHLPATSDDESARVITSHAGVSGSILTGSLAARYAATATRLEVDSLGDALPLRIGQDRILADVFVEAGAPLSRFRFGTGVSVGRQEIADTIRQRRTERVWSTFTGAREAATVELERSLGVVRAGASLRQARSLADSQTLAVTLTAFNAWLDSDNAWMEGFRSPVAHGRSTGAADARIELTTAPLVGLLPTWYVRGFAFSGLAGSGTDFGIAGGFVASSPTVKRSVASVRGEISQAIGDAGADDASTPGGFIEASASTVAPGRFHLAASARYAPRTLWPPLEPGAMVYLPETRRIDFSVNKPMWHDRVRAQLVVRNVLNAREVTHPLGAQWNLRTHLAVTIALPPVPGGTSR